VIRDPRAISYPNRLKKEEKLGKPKNFEKKTSKNSKNKSLTTSGAPAALFLSFWQTFWALDS